ncbi:TetR family transcriptional regulator [Dactylosporangium aurantiacum]|uniref:TetR family transcriptional regulator n=1 Tax=Dactylosporangium aurantiacum TaxID=35754 RepID=A0A9Q9IQH0_9ACTN|nr:TetR family transcriptional regulator [Dactylosporangium aurantiacum]MDG6110360.1 TetR family transcriptional regulator [Dactylosporangium aurantiacum]UWZ58130.1 TetR family transcriptional regulator [Dactylosporangium aurantiacum]
MAIRTRTTAPRGDALSRQRIVEAAVELLDAEGEAGLTFRALSARLKTGPGAIYWHVANKDELLLAATDAVLATTGAGPDPRASPEETIRGVALGLFDAIDEHPWLAVQLSRSPWQSMTLRLFDRVGQQVQALGVPAAARFTSASALLIYILGAARQNAANARTQRPGADRTAILERESATWEGLDATEYPFLHDVAGQLRDHDDRAQFLAGVDLILAGIRAVAP